jgi:hypothetical protein
MERHSGRGSMSSQQVEELLRTAGRQHRRVRATYQYEGEHGVQQCERYWEPYAVRDGAAVVYSYFRDEFRTVPLAHIVDVEICAQEFKPRREVEL